jgi:hypothetical protein
VTFSRRSDRSCHSAQCTADDCQQSGSGCDQQAVVVTTETVVVVAGMVVVEQVSTVPPVSVKVACASGVME